MLLFIATLLPQVGWAQTTSQPQKGDGSKDNPYEISTAAELAWFRDYVNAGNTSVSAVLTNDIDLKDFCHAADETKNVAGLSWLPIGGILGYYGSFDGKNHIIRNLYISISNSREIGFFGCITHCSIKNLIFENAYIDASNNCDEIGVLAGRFHYGNVQNIKLLENCSVKGYRWTGGLIGYINVGDLAYCENYASVNGVDVYTGGISGYSGDGNFTSCSNFGDVVGVDYVGGLFGNFYYHTAMKECANYGSVEGHSCVGGIFGISEYNCEGGGNILSMGNLKGSDSYVGIVGGYVGYVGGGKVNSISINGIVAYSNSATMTIDGTVQESDKIKIVGEGTLRIKDQNDIKGFSFEQLKSGEVTYLLNGSTSKPADGENLAWYQEIGKDNYPVLAPNCYGIVEKDVNGDYVNISHNPNADGICSICGNYVSAPPTQGDGTAANPYQIEKPCHLAWFRDQVNAGTKDICATLVNDIDLRNYCHKASNGKSELSWEPIGKDDANLWRGTFEGNGHTISNLYVHNSQSNSGLFGCVANSTISNVIVEGEVNGQNSTGGLVGYSKGSNITHCENRVIVKGVRFVGGICGVFETNGNTVSNCINKSSVTSTDRSAGGIIGSLSSGNIQDCANYANIVGTYNVGGIIGWASSGTVKNAFSYSNVKATDNTNRIGLIIGALSGSSSNVSGVLAYYDGAKRISNNAELTLEAIGSGSPGGTYSKQSYSAEALASGKATYALNGSTSASSVSWYQKIGTDAYPLLTSKGGDIVYHGTECNKTTDVYTNDNSIFGADGAIPHNMVETAETNGLYCETCTKCHAAKEQGVHYIKDFCGSGNNLKLSLQSDNTYKAVDSKVTITDKDAYNSPVDFTVDELDYTREYLGNDMWQAVYVPFDMDATEWTNNGITAASINNFHEYELEDGSYETVLEVKKATSGSLTAHTPYVIRSTEDGNKTITIHNAQLRKAASQTIDCQSVTRKYEFTGIYAPQSGFNADGSSSLVYALSKQGTMAPLSNTATLGAQRWYLTITDRNASSTPQASMARDIRIKVIGEGTATGINDLRVLTSKGINAPQSGIYDLQGRKMNVAPAHGIYIKNGKKYVK